MSAGDDVPASVNPIAAGSILKFGTGSGTSARAILKDIVLLNNDYIADTNDLNTHLSWKLTATPAPSTYPIYLLGTRLSTAGKIYPLSTSLVQTNFLEPLNVSSLTEYAITCWLKVTPVPTFGSEIHLFDLTDSEGTIMEVYVVWYDKIRFILPATTFNVVLLSNNSMRDNWGLIGFSVKNGEQALYISRKSQRYNTFTIAYNPSPIINQLTFTSYNPSSNILVSEYRFYNSYLTESAFDAITDLGASYIAPTCQWNASFQCSACDNHFSVLADTSYCQCLYDIYNCESLYDYCSFGQTNPEPGICLNEYSTLTFNFERDSFDATVEDTNSKAAVKLVNGTEFFPTHTPGDPIAAKGRGVYFDGTGYMKVELNNGWAPQFGLNWYVKAWVRPTDVGCLLQIKNPGTQYFSICFTDITQLTLDINFQLFNPVTSTSSAQNFNKYYFTENRVNYEWHVVIFSFEFDSDQYRVLLNDISQTQAITGYVYIATDSVHYLGKQTATHYKGFIYQLEYGNTAYPSSTSSQWANTTTCVGCSTCFPGQTTCLPQCEIDEYYDDATSQCAKCLATCSYCRRANDCNLCSVAGCQTCTGYESACTTCKGSVDNADCSCNAGRYHDANESCQNCSTISNCDQCAYDSSLSAPFISCSSCTTNYVVTNNACTCPTGNYVDGAGDCISCGANCLGCADTTGLCTECETSFVPNATLCECPAAQYEYQGTCLNCEQDCNSCSHNGTSVVCASCDNGLVPSANICVCPAGSTFNDSRACVACPSNCTSCHFSNSITVCDVCDRGYEVSGGNCICSQANSGYIDNLGSCSVCPVDCQTCYYNYSTASVYCDSCIATYSLNEGQCDCPVGTYEYNGQCSVCSTANCGQCHHNGVTDVCDVCKSPWTKQGAVCICGIGNYIDSQNLCKVCPYECATCQSDPPQCVTCNPGYSFWFGECKHCGEFEGFGGFYSLGYPAIIQYDLTQLLSSCTEVCGDGVIYTSGCDDGNNINGDGCSSTCTVEAGYQCTLNAKGRSECIADYLDVSFAYVGATSEGYLLRFNFSKGVLLSELVNYELSVSTTTNLAFTWNYGRYVELDTMDISIHIPNFVRQTFWVNVDVRDPHAFSAKNLNQLNFSAEVNPFCQEYKNSKCIACIGNYQLTSTGGCQCQAGSYVTEFNNCVECPDICQTCSFIDNAIQCTSCSNSDQVIALTSCHYCSEIEGYGNTPSIKYERLSISDKYNINKNCEELCNDGLELGQYPCEDGNQINGDGCDVQCNIEPGYKCNGGECSNKSFEAELQYVELNDNEFILTLNFSRVVTIQQPVEDIFYVEVLPDIRYEVKYQTFYDKSRRLDTNIQSIFVKIDANSPTEPFTKVKLQLKYDVIITDLFGFELEQIQFEADLEDQYEDNIIEAKLICYIIMSIIALGLVFSFAVGLQIRLNSFNFWQSVLKLQTLYLIMFIDVNTSPYANAFLRTAKNATLSFIPEYFGFPVMTYDNFKENSGRLGEEDLDTDIIINLGNLATFWASAITVFLFSQFLQASDSKFTLRVQRSFNFSFIIRSMQISFIPLLMSIFLQSNDLTIYNTESIYSIICFCTVIIILIAYIFSICNILFTKNNQQLQQGSMISYFGSIYGQFKTDKIIYKIFGLIPYIYFIGFTSIIVYMQGLSSIQCNLLIILQLITVIITAIIRPFVNFYTGTIPSLVGDILIAIVLICYMILDETQDLSVSDREDMGLIIVIAGACAILIHALAGFIDIGSGLLSYQSRRRRTLTKEFKQVKEVVWED